MKKIIMRIIAFALALYISFISVFNSYNVKVEAAETIALSYELISYGANNPAIQKLLANALIYGGIGGCYIGAIASPGGSGGHAISPELANQIIADFNSGAMENALLNVAVIQPAQAAKWALWDTPSAAIADVLEKSGAGIAVISDTAEGLWDSASKSYLSVSDALYNALASFLSTHVKDGVYYSHPLDEDISKINKIGEVGSTYHFSGKQVTTNTEYDRSVSSLAFNMNGTTYVKYPCFGVKHYSNYSLYNLYTISFALIGGKWCYQQFIIDWDINLIDIYSCDLPVFDVDKMSIYGQENSFEIFKDALNWDDVIALYPDVLWPTSDAANRDWAIDWPISIGALEGVAEGVGEAVEDYVGDIPIDVPIDLPIDTPIDLPIDIPWPIPVPWPEVIDTVIDDPIDIPDDPDEPIPVDPPAPDDIDLDIPDDSGGDPLMDLSKFFPFCLPMDLYLAFHLLAADPKPPVFEIPVTIHLSGVNQQDINHKFVIDVIQPAGEGTGSAEPFVRYLRWFLTFLFIVFLIFTSIKITPH